METSNDILAPRLTCLLRRATHRGVVDRVASDVVVVASEVGGKLSVENLECIAQVIFKKALDEPHHGEALAYLTQSLRNMSPQVDDAHPHHCFHAVLLNLCQLEFEKKLFDHRPLGILVLMVTMYMENDELCLSCCDLGGTARFTRRLRPDAKVSSLLAIVEKHCEGYCIHDVECFDVDSISEVPDSRLLRNSSNLVLKCSVETMNDLTPDEMEQKRQDTRNSRLAFMKFVGQLFALRCVCKKHVLAIIDGVIDAVDVGALPGKDAIEALCELLAVVGPKLDQGHHSYGLRVTHACERMTSMRCKSTRVRFLLQNFLEKRQV